MRSGNGEGSLGWGYPLFTIGTALASLLVLMLQSYVPSIVNGLIKLSTTVRAYIGLFSTIGFLHLIVQWIVHIVSNIMAHCTNFLPTLTAFFLPVTSPFICDITLHTDLISIPHDFFTTLTTLSKTHSQKLELCSSSHTTHSTCGNALYQLFPGSRGPQTLLLLEHFPPLSPLPGFNSHSLTSRVIVSDVNRRESELSKESDIANNEKARPKIVLRLGKLNLMNLTQELQPPYSRLNLEVNAHSSPTSELPPKVESSTNHARGILISYSLVLLC